MTTRPRTKPRRGRGGVIPLLLLSLVASAAAQSAFDPSSDPSETCRDVLYASDADGDGVLRGGEYAAFVAATSGGGLGTTGSFGDLPFGLRVTFVYLSCCAGGPTPDGGTRVDAADGGAGIVLGNGEGGGGDYLGTVCDATRVAIEDARAIAGLPRSPTAGPSHAPSANAPTVAEGPTTTPSPSTEAPVVVGVAEPPPTAAPADGPTEASVVDAGAPTASPVEGTGAPSTEEAPTEAPVAGAEAPTGAPSQAPVVGAALPMAVVPPAKAPAVNATAPPTAEPTAAPTPGASSTATGGTGAPTPGVETVHPTGSAQLYIPSGAVRPPADAEPPAASPPTDEGRGGLHLGPAVAVVLVAALVASVAGYAYRRRRGRRDPEDPALRDVAHGDPDDLEVGRDGKRRADARPDAERMGGDVPRPGGGAGAGSRGDAATAESDSRGGASVDAGRAVRPAGGARDGPDDAPGARGSPRSSSARRAVVVGVAGVPEAVASPRRNEGADGASVASEGGWSGSADVSSLNMASFDAGTDDGPLLRSPDRWPAAIGAWDAVAHAAGQRRDKMPPIILPLDDQIDSSTSGDSMGDRRVTSPVEKYFNLPSPSKASEDLNAAIQVGDWAMVGNTAALLADFTHSDQSVSSASHSGASDSSTGKAHSARELDRMVERGDWEGVVLAAAQFDGTESSQQNACMMGSASKSCTTMEEGPRSKEEVRSEVERLVRTVVPDEVDNIDEMMLQFDGREEELIKTLHTMQENVAARSTEVRANASVSSSVVSASSSVPSAKYHQRKMRTGSFTASEHPHYGDSIAGSSTIGSYRDDSSVSDVEMSNCTDRDISLDISRKTVQLSIELAIERRDWHAVSEMAAVMGKLSALASDADDSVSTMSHLALQE